MNANQILNDPFLLNSIGESEGEKRFYSRYDGLSKAHKNILSERNQPFGTSSSTSPNIQHEKINQIKQPKYLNRA